MVKMDDEAKSKRTHNLMEFEPEPEYNTEDNFIVKDFYAPCLARSNKYDRAVGYFRANIYRELGEDLLNFAKRGGKVRLICSPDIPEPDEEAAREGYELRGKRTEIDKEISLLQILRKMAKDPKEKDCLDMLRLLIEKDSMELFVATRTGGIYHRKVGVFYDAHNNYIAFSGSGNETQRAVSEIEDWANDEEFDVYRSWGTEFESHKAESKANYFRRLLETGTSNTKVRPLNVVEREEISKHRSHSDFDDCLPGARERSAKINDHELKTTSKYEAVINGRKIKPYYFQQLAIEQWNQNQHVGMLSMATGTGKTYTALFALNKFIKEGRLAVIVVPSKLLLEQWSENIREFYPGIPLLLAGGGNNWKTNSMKRIFISNIKQPKIILATMATAASLDFITFLHQANDPILVADEAHRIGSPIYRSILSKIPFKERLGLSATPERLFDDEGNDAIKKAFGESPVYLLPLSGKVRLSEEDEEEIPILGNFLSKYYYYFDIVHLTHEEQQEWNEITKQIKEFARRHPELRQGEGTARDQERLELLYIQRSRILKRAEGKIELACKAITDKYSDGSRWIIYCEDEGQMNSIADAIREQNKDLAVLIYHSNMGESERDRTLQYFERHPSVIVSIRCLDEGVDIPIVDGALILASSTNPRQYIQRRGRVLRRAKGKRIAIIIDALVLPETAGEDEQMPVVRSELSRAWHFAETAENSEITHELWKIGIKYGADLINDEYISLQEESLEE
jgi:superfamily II DNA or RNA helicase